MPAASHRHLVQWDDVGAVTVIRFMVKCVRADEVISAIFDELERVTEENGRCQLVLNLSPVQQIASYAMGKIVALNKRLQPPNGRLALCCLTPLVSEIIAIMRLQQDFNIYPSEAEALASFHYPSG